MELKLPKKGRPLSVRYRACELGVDLPAQFIYDLKSLDENLFPIFHPYKIIWDDMVNEYVGSLDDPRYSIVENSFKAGELVMGHILSNGKGELTPDGHWHIWRWCEPARAWAHIINIDINDPVYLQLLVNRLWLQARYNDKYSHKQYQKLLEESDLEQRAKIQNDKQELLNEIYNVNSAMVNRAMDNFSRKNVKPTNPKKESIFSFSGQKSKRRTVRPLIEDEGGLVLP